MENAETLKAGDKIALYSYGSGAVSEFFSGELVEGYEAYLDKDRLSKLKQRTELSVAYYEKSSSKNCSWMSLAQPNLQAMNIKTMPWLKLSTTNADIARLKNNEDKLEWIF